MAIQDGARPAPNRYARLSGDILLAGTYLASPGLAGQPGPGSGRGVVREFSEGSRRRMLRYLRECRARYQVMVTLTYPSDWPLDGALVKLQLEALWKRIKRSRPGMHSDSVFWFLEFQERGAPHFHLFTTFRIDRFELSQWWYEIVASGDERHLRAGTRIETLRAGNKGLRSYASKYAAKAEQKVVPDNFQNVGRFWGVLGSRSTVAASVNISPAMLEVERVRLLTDCLRNEIKRGIARGSIKMIRNNYFNCAVMVIETAPTRNIIEGLIEELAGVVSDHLPFIGIGF